MAGFHLGVVAYHWSRQPASRWVGDVLAPAAARLAGLDGSPTDFWYTAFDARAPHLFAIYTLPEPPAASQVEDFGQALRRAMASDPLPVELSREEVEERHLECRGKELCRADALPGLAEPNTLEVFEHSPHHYPFTVLGTCPRPAALWQQWGEVCAWARSHLGNGSRSLAGILWIAAVERELRRRPDLARHYWRRHAESLLPPLVDRLESEGETVVVEGLPALLGARNLELFERVWEQPEDSSRELVRRLLDLLLPPQSSHHTTGMGQLREVNHVLGQQLMIPVRAQLPHLLYAWWRSAS